MVGYVAPRFSGTDALGSKALRWMSDPNINRSFVNPHVVTNFCSSTFLRKVIIQRELLVPRVHGNRDEHPCSRLFCRGNLSPPPLLSISLQAKTTLPDTFTHLQSTVDINMAKTTTLKEFESVFPKLAEDVLDHAKSYNLPEEFVKWYKDVNILSFLAKLSIDTYTVTLCQHYRWKMQPWHVRPRFRLPHPRSPSL
jgi:hypothetical protein